MEKAKLTLWVPRETTLFGKRWVKRHRESISQLVADYLNRLKTIEEGPGALMPVVRRLSGVIKDKTAGKEAYKKRLMKKYSDA
jgi:Family of unknown function (DUF6364)